MPCGTTHDKDNSNIYHKVLCKISSVSTVLSIDNVMYGSDLNTDILRINASLMSFTQEEHFELSQSIELRSSGQSWDNRTSLIRLATNIDIYIRQRSWANVMYSPLFVCLSVCLSVCLLAGLLKKLWTDLNEI